MPIFIDSDDDSESDVEIEPTSFDNDTCCPPKNLFFNSQYLFSIIDVADIYNYKILDNPDYENLDTFHLKLKPINITFDAFKKVNFKKRSGKYNFFCLNFTNELIQKLKATLIQKILKNQHKITYKDKLFSKKSILLSKEILSIHLIKQVEDCIVIDYPEFVKMFYATQATHARITLNLFISALSIKTKVEFLFKLKEVPVPPQTDELSPFIFEN
jgi:hypothetical protein